MGYLWVDCSGHSLDRPGDQPTDPRLPTFFSSDFIGNHTKMENNQNGRQPKCKTAKMEDDQNAKLTKWKTNKMENDQN